MKRMLGNFLRIKNARLKWLINVILLILIVMALIYSYFTNNKTIRFIIVIIICMMTVSELAIMLYQVKKFLWNRYKVVFVGSFVYALILAIVLMIPFLEHFYINASQISENDWLSFYGDFITFAGAFRFRYFSLWKRNQV